MPNFSGSESNDFPEKFGIDAVGLGVSIGTIREKAFVVPRRRSSSGARCRRTLHQRGHLTHLFGGSRKEPQRVRIKEHDEAAVATDDGHEECGLRWYCEKLIRGDRGHALRG